MVADFHSILVRLRKHFSQLLKVRGVIYVMQREIHTAEPLVLQPSAFDVGLVIVKSKKSHITRYCLSSYRTDKGKGKNNSL